MMRHDCLADVDKLNGVELKRFRFRRFTRKVIFKGNLRSQPQKLCKLLKYQLKILNNCGLVWNEPKPSRGILMNRFRKSIIADWGYCK